MIRLPLRNKHGVVVGHALIDDDDFRLARYRWCMTKGYVVRGVKIPGTRKNRLIRLHREVLGLVHGDGLEGDHENGNKLDNRRSNLRVVTHSQQLQNRVQFPGRSQYRGVAWHNKTSKWRAYATTNGKQNHLGLFTDELDAAIAARDFRVEHMTHSNESRHPIDTRNQNEES